MQHPRQLTASLCRCIALLTLLASCAGFCGAQALAKSPAPATQHMTPPDVQVLILRDSTGRDMVDLTYPKVVSAAQAERDVSSVLHAAKLHTTDVDISNDALPLAGVKPIPMTSATFQTIGAGPSGESTFRLEPWIVALRGYPNLAITYMMPKSFKFNGLRMYKNHNVEIALDQRGATYTYHVRVLDGNFDRLNIPLLQPDARAMQYAQDQEQRESRLKIFGLIAVSALAAVVGYAVYALLSRLH